jgi:hypothetical protein
MRVSGSAIGLPPGGYRFCVTEQAVTPHPGSASRLRF